MPYQQPATRSLLKHLRRTRGALSLFNFSTVLPLCAPPRARNFNSPRESIILSTTVCAIFQWFCYFYYDYLSVTSVVGESLSDIRILVSCIFTHFRGEQSHSWESDLIGTQGLSLMDLPQRVQPLFKKVWYLFYNTVIPPLVRGFREARNSAQKPRTRGVRAWWGCPNICWTTDINSKIGQNNGFVILH